MTLDVAIINLSMDFSEWITKKYIAWRGDAVGHDRSISEFAAWLGVGQSLMSHWMRKGGKIPKSQDAIGRLVDKFGFEVYDVLGLPRPVEEIALYESLPGDIREPFEAAMREIAEEYSRLGITDPDSPAASEIAIKTLRKFGFTVRTRE